MPTAMYDRQWREAMTILLDQVQKESSADPRTVKMLGPQVLQQQLSWFLTYLRVYRMLEECYDQMVHPQKRLVVRRALDAVVGRLLETRQNVCALTGSWTPDLFGLVNNAAVLPQDLEVPAPRFAVGDNPILAKRNDLLRMLIDRYGTAAVNGSCFDSTHAAADYVAGTGATSSQALPGAAAGISIDDAILYIQRTERGRAARLRAKLVRDIIKVTPNRASEGGADRLSREAACTIIQKNWRAAGARRHMDARRQADLVFLGLATASAVPGKGNSYLPLVQSMVSAECARREQAYERAALARLEANKAQLDRFILDKGKAGSADVGGVPTAALVSSLAPRTAAVPMSTCSNAESVYTLSRHVDKVNATRQQPYLLAPTNAADAGLAFAHANVRNRVLQADAQWMDGPGHQRDMVERRRKAAQIQAEAAMQEAQGVLAEEVRTVEGGALRLALHARHREALQQFRDLNDGALPTGPLDVATPDERLMMDAVALEREARAPRTGKKGKKGKKGRKGAKGAKGASAKKGSGSGAEPKPRAAAKVPPEEEDPDRARVAFLSPYIATIVDSTVEYFNRWQRHDPANLAEQPYDADYLKELLRPGVFKDVYDEVWAQVEADLESMRVIIEATREVTDGAKKGKNSKKGKKGKKGSKGKKGKKGSKGKVAPPPEEPAPVGPAGDPSVEAAFAELVSEGIIKAVKPAQLREFVGAETFLPPASAETQFIQTEARKALQKFAQTGTVDQDRRKHAPAGAEPGASTASAASAGPGAPSSEAPGLAEAAALMPNLPSYNQIKQQVIADIILPLASPIARAIPHSNTFLIYGAEGTGKTLLSRIVATEVGALWIDVSPATIANRLPGPEVADIFRLIRTVLAANQPCVVYFDEAELILSDAGAKGKKGSKGKRLNTGDDYETPGYSMLSEGYPKTADQQYNPVRVKKELASLLKAINQFDGVVVIGNCSHTFAKEKALLGFFQRFIYIPLPDYSTRILLLSHFFERLGMPEYSITGVGKDVSSALFGVGTVVAGSDDVRKYTSLGLMGLNSGMATGGASTLNTPFDLFTLARVTEGFTAGQLEKAIHSVCTASRLAGLSAKPLTVIEFGPVLAALGPQYDSQVAHAVMLGGAKTPPDYKPPVEIEAADPKKRR